MGEQQEPQRISTPGQPDTFVPERKSLSAIPHITNEQYQANKTIINGYRAYKLEQLKKQGDAK